MFSYHAAHMLIEETVESVQERRIFWIKRFPLPLQMPELTWKTELSDLFIRCTFRRQMEER